VGRFVQVPTVVDAAARAGCLEVDLFPPILTDIGDVEVAVGAVEEELPRVA